MQQPSNYRWLVLFASFLAFVAFAFAFQLMPPLLELVKKDFNINDIESGLLTTAVMIPGIFLALPVGLIVNKHGFRLLGFLSAILAAIGSLMTALSTTYLMALLGRAVLGIGAAFIIVGTPTLIPQWFSQKDLGKAMGIYSANMPLATILAFPVATVLSQTFGWHYPFYVGTVIGVTAAVIFLLIVREGPLRSEPTKVQPGQATKPVKYMEVWKVSLVWMLFNTTAIGFLAWAPTLFVTFKGLQQLESTLLASVLMYAALIFVPFFGWVSDKTRRRKPFMIVGSILLASALNAASYVNGFPLFLAVVILGIAAAMVPPLVMAVTADSLPTHLAGTGFGIVTLCQNIGITLSAPFAGYILQTTGGIESTFFGISLFAFAAAVIALTLRSR